MEPRHVIIRLFKTMDLRDRHSQTPTAALLAKSAAQKIQMNAFFVYSVPELQEKVRECAQSPLPFLNYELVEDGKPVLTANFQEAKKFLK